MEKINHAAEIRISQVRTSELSILEQISSETFIESFAGQNTAEDISNYIKKSFNSSQLLSEVNNGSSFFYFIFYDNEPAGYLKLNINEAQTENKGDANSLEIERIYLLKKFKRLGLGKRLLEFAKEIAKAKNKQAIWLGVWEKNEEAILFYTKTGFQRYGKHVFQLGNDAQTDLLFRLQLTDL